MKENDARELTKLGAFWELVFPMMSDHFRPQDRVVDCCSGNLLLSKYAVDLTWVGQVYAIDKRMTARAGYTRERFAQGVWGERVVFLERDIFEDGFSFPPVSLVMAVHACGNLTDRILELCMPKKIPLAVSPCCYNRSRIWYKADIPFRGDLGEHIDLMRVERLKEVYDDVCLLQYSERITPMNRIILAR